MNQEFAKIFKALADETRLTMALELLDRDEVTCKELSTKFGLSQPTLSHHYNKLIAVGIVSSRKEGAAWYYKLNQDRLLKLGIDLRQLRNG